MKAHSDKVPGLAPFPVSYAFIVTLVVFSALCLYKQIAMPSTLSKPVFPLAGLHLGLMQIFRSS